MFYNKELALGSACLTSRHPRHNSAAYKGCEAHKRAVQVQNVRMKEKITYAEAIKKS